MASDQRSTRERFAASTDVRAQRTRARLVSAFDELAVAEERLSVASVVARSGVNRTTFYSHYSSIEDLAVEALGEFFDVVASVDASERGRGHDASTSERSLEEVAGFIGDRRSVYGSLLERNTFSAAVEEAFTERNRATLRAVKSLPSHVDVEVAARFVAAGVLGVVSAWLRDGAVDQASVIATRISDVLPTWFVVDE